MITGALRSIGIHADETKLGKILKEFNPNVQKARQYSAGSPIIQKYIRLTTSDTKSIIIKTKSWQCMG